MYDQILNLQLLFIIIKLDYNKYLYDKFFLDSINKYEKLLDQNFEQKVEINNNYDDQILEMEKFIYNGNIFFFSIY